MKLSEAILLGSVETEQGFGPFSIYTDGKTKCALGAALVAVGAEVTNNSPNPYVIVDQHWPWTYTTHVNYPGQSEKGRVIRALTAIWTLNDQDKWTRPQIAAWVATIEPKEEEHVDGNTLPIYHEVDTKVVPR